MNRRNFFALAMGSSSLIANPASLVNDYPSRPVKIIAPFEAGGTTDIMARMLAEDLGRQYNEIVMVENRIGANGIIGTEVVARAKPDGLTLLFVSSSFAINPTVYRKLKYDAQRDFVPIADFARGKGFLILTPAALPVKTLQDLIDKSKDLKNNWNYSTAGFGNSTHLAAEMFTMKTGSRFTAVPYKGSGAAVNAVLSGEVQLSLQTPYTALSQVQAGRLKALAFTGPKRLIDLPDVPTLLESGYPSLVMDGSWLALFAPAGTPIEIISKLHRGVNIAMQRTKVAEAVRKGGYDLGSGNSSEEFSRFVGMEIQRYAEIAKSAKIELQ